VGDSVDMNQAHTRLINWKFQSSILLVDELGVWFLLVIFLCSQQWSLFSNLFKRQSIKRKQGGNVSTRLRYISFQGPTIIVSSTERNMSFWWNVI